jgi:hypothetical protein
MGERLDLATWDGAFHSFLASPGKWDWLVPWARDSRCLPIYCDWTHALGIHESGDIVSHQVEEWPGKQPATTDCLLLRRSGMGSGGRHMGEQGPRQGAYGHGHAG